MDFKGWPVWRKGQELKASHLAGLEEYLRARIELTDNTGHGVDFFDPGNVATGVRDDSLSVSLTNVRGVTPGGHPVVISPNASITGQIGLQKTPLEFDMTVFVDSGPQEAPPEETSTAVRLVLALDGVSAGKSAPALRDNGLYLGRMQWANGSKLTLTLRPLVRNFSALQPVEDDAWIKWTAPLTDILSKLLASVDPSRIAPTPAATALTAELYRTAFDWLRLPLPALWRRVQFLNWLHGQLRTGVAAPVRQVYAAFTPTDASGEGLPTACAQLFDSEIVVVHREIVLAAPADLQWNERNNAATLRRDLPAGRLIVRLPAAFQPTDKLILQVPLDIYKLTARDDRYEADIPPFKAGETWTFTPLGSTAATEPPKLVLVPSL